MSIVLFAILGAAIEAGAGYWICFGGYCIWRVLSLAINLMSGND